MAMTEDSHVGKSIQLDNDYMITERKRAQVKATEDSFVFPASVSTFRQAHVAASTPNSIGIWAYVAEETLVVVRPAILPRKWPRFTLLDGSGWSKYTSVSFCQELDRRTWPIPDAPLVTASQDGIVRVWDIEKNATIKYHEQHWGRQTIVEWSPRNSNLIYAMDIQGQMSIWDVKLNVLTHANFEKIRANCIAISPYENDTMAVGTIDGDVYILNTSGAGAIVHKMRHADQVCTVSWKPPGSWTPDPNKSTQVYLASSVSSVKPPFLMIWDCRGKEVTSLTPWEYDSKDRKLVKSYVPTLWTIHPTTREVGLVSCGLDGDVVVWNSGDPDPRKVFSLNPNYLISGFTQCGDILWTFTKERVAIGWNLVTEKRECTVPMCNGIANIKVCPSEPSRVAIGGLDGMIRIVKMDQNYPEDTDSDLPIISDLQKGQISALAWHPRSEKIAFGTNEGMIGVFECKQDAKFTMIFDRHIHGTVYTVDWGAHCYTEGYQIRERNTDESEKPEPLWIYACGNRTLSMIHPSRRNNALVSTMRTISASNSGLPAIGNNTSVSDMKWSPDQLYLAIGYGDGKIAIYQAPHLKLRCWIKCHAGGIQYLGWRPQDFEGDSMKRVWFASCGNDATAKVFDLSKLHEPDFLSGSDIVRRISSDGILNGHSGLRVISLAWSPHDDNLLLTTSYDRTAVVWNIQDRTRVARYVGHDHRLVAGIFHPTDPYKVITASDEMTSDSCLHVWDYRSHPEKENYDNEKGFESMSGEIVEYVKAQAAPLAKVIFRAGGSGDGPVTQEDEEDAPEELIAEEKLITKLLKCSTLFPMTNRTSERNSFLDELKYIVDKTPIPNELNECSKQQITEENSIPKSIDDEQSFLVQILHSATATDLADDPVLHLAVLNSKEDSLRMVQKQGLLHGNDLALLRLNPRVWIFLKFFSCMEWKMFMDVIQTYYLLEYLQFLVDEYLKKEDWSGLANLIEYTDDPKSILVTLIKANYLNYDVLFSARKYSKELGKQAAAAYTKRLIESGEFHHAASVLLVEEDIYEAVDTLLNQMLFWDALHLSKVRSLDLTPEIIPKWIQFLS